MTTLTQGLSRRLKALTRKTGLLAAASVALILADSTSLQTAQANGDTRTLRMHHTHTGENIQITYKRDGRYDADALKKISWFLRDWRRDEPTSMDPRLFDLVWEVYRDVGGTEPVTIVSAYRSPATNAMLRSRSRGVAKFSQHMMGKAMDFYIPGVSLSRVRETGMKKQRGGVGFYPTSGSPFVHLDVGSVRAWPRMTRDQLARVFPDGNTIHLPADGKPLSGYHQTLARIGKDGKNGGGSGGMLAYAPSGGNRGSWFGGDNSSPNFAGESRGNNIISRIFGRGGADDEGDDTEVSTPAARSKTRTPEPVRAPVQVAARSSDDEETPAKPQAAPVPVPAPARAAPPAAAPANIPFAIAPAPATQTAMQAPVPQPKPTQIAQPQIAPAQVAALAPAPGANAPVPMPKPTIVASAPAIAAGLLPSPAAPVPMDKPQMLALIATPPVPANAGVPANAVANTPMPLDNPRRNAAITQTAAASAMGSTLRQPNSMLTALRYDAATVKPFVAASQSASAAPILTGLGSTDRRNLREFVTTRSMQATEFNQRSTGNDSFSGQTVRIQRSRAG